MPHSPGREREISLAAPSDIYIPMVSHQLSGLLRFVSDELMTQPGVPEALKTIGIKQATPALELTAFIREGSGPLRPGRGRLSGLSFAVSPTSMRRSA